MASLVIRWLLFFALISCAVKVSTATNCVSDGGMIQTADLSQLITIVQGNQLNPPMADPFSLQVSITEDFTHQTSMICVENQNSGPFDGASVSLAEVADGASAIQAACCSSACQGGETMIIPDYGPPIYLTVRSSDYSCSIWSEWWWIDTWKAWIEPDEADHSRLVLITRRQLVKLVIKGPARSWNWCLEQVSYRHIRSATWDRARSLSAGSSTDHELCRCLVACRSTTAQILSLVALFCAFGFHVIVRLAFHYIGAFCYSPWAIKMTYEVDFWNQKGYNHLIESTGAVFVRIDSMYLRTK